MTEILKGSVASTLNLLQSSLFKRLFHDIYFSLRSNWSLVCFTKAQLGMAPLSNSVASSEQPHKTHLLPCAGWKWGGSPLTKKTCPLALQQAIHNVKLDNTWNSKLDFATFKKATSKAAKQQSWSIDKLELAQKLYAWAVLQSYTSWSLLPFLTTHIEAPIQHALLLFRLGELPSEDLAPTWKHPWPDNQWRLNGYGQESLLHLMCVCPALLPLRQKLLQTALRVLQFRSCHPQ